MFWAPQNRKAAQRRPMAVSDAVQAKLHARKSLRAIAAELNTEGVPTAQGGQWHLTSVKRLVEGVPTAAIHIASSQEWASFVVESLCSPTRLGSGRLGPARRLRRS